MPKLFVRSPDRHLLTRLAALVLVVAGVAAAPPQAAPPGETEPAAAVSAERITPDAAAAPFLWRIGTSPPSYLFGTIHLPDPRVLELAAPVERALDASAIVHTEVPLDAATQAEMVAGAMLEDGQSLRELLPEDLYARTDAYLVRHGLSIAPFVGFKLWALSAQLAMLDYLPQLMAREPLDMMLYRRAESAGKAVGAIETVAEQLAVFDALSLDEQIALHRQTLDQLEEAAASGDSPARRLVDAYLSGDGGRLLAEVDASVDRSDPVGRRFLTLLLDERNVTIAGRIAARLADSPDRTQFFAVGAGHLPGPKGVVALLEGRGFTVSRVASAEPAAQAAPAASGR